MNVVSVAATLAVAVALSVAASLAGAASPRYDACENCVVAPGAFNSNLSRDLLFAVGGRERNYVLNGNTRNALVADNGQGRKTWILNVRDSRTILNGDLSGVLFATVADGRRAWVLNVRTQ